MYYSSYEVEISTSHLQFEFFSNGPRGKIKKRIVFKEQEENPGIYNLGFGDVDSFNNINDTVVTDNKDSKKVLMTVAIVVYNFLENHQDSYVFAKGSTASRTRLYQIGISNNLIRILKDFEIYGWSDHEWKKFKKGSYYESFLIKKKNT